MNTQVCGSKSSHAKRDHFLLLPTEAKARAVHWKHKWSFFPCCRVWEVDAEHSTRSPVNGEQCVCHCHRRVALSSGAKAPRCWFSCFPNPTNIHILSAAAFCLECPTQVHRTGAHSSLKHPNALQLSQLDDYAYFLVILVLIIVSEHREWSRGCFPHPSLSNHQLRLNSGKAQLKSFSHQLFKNKTSNFKLGIPSCHQVCGEPVLDSLLNFFICLFGWFVEVFKLQTREWRWIEVSQLNVLDMGPCTHCPSG